MIRGPVGNTRFNYLYRDASNYKQFGSVVFRGPPEPKLVERLKISLDSGEFFIAQQVGLRSVSLAEGDDYPANEDDHCWHEFAGVEESDAANTDDRTFENFVVCMERSKTEGWREFEPRPDPLLREFRNYVETKTWIPFRDFNEKRRS